MTSNIEDGEDFTLDELVSIIRKLKEKKSPGPDRVINEFLSELGNGLLIPLLNLFNIVKKSKQIPKQWYSVLIQILYKNKGSRKSIVNYRGIFLASVVSKVFEKLIKGRMKSHMKKVNLCQAGARPERSPGDNLFLANAAIDHHKYIGKSLHITAYDFKQAFDSLWLQDCILSLRNLDVPDDILKLIYNLNKEALITVKTPYGPTTSALIRDIVQQGRVLAPDLCSASTGEFCGKSRGVAIGTLILSSLAFVDDLLEMSSSCVEAEIAHSLAVVFGFKKKMEYSAPKCKALGVNCKKNELLPDLFIEGKRLENAESIAYVGDILQRNGGNAALIKDRMSRGTKVILQIETILSEIPFGKHTIVVWLLLYRALFLSSILFNSQAWRNLSNDDLKQLKSLQLRILRKICGTSSSVSTSFIFLELGVLPIKYEIHKRQLNNLHHIINLGPDDPVRLAYENMKLLPAESNWFNDIKKLSTLYNITIDETEIRKISKDAFKKVVSRAVERYALSELKKECGNQSKTKEINYSELKLQPYLYSLYPSTSRTILKCRAKCLEIKSHRPYKFANTVCRWCNMAEEDFAHIINCGYGNVEIVPIDVNCIDVLCYEDECKLISVASRVQDFLDRVNY